MANIDSQLKNQWLAALEEIEAEMRYAQPEAMDVLLQKYDFIMQQMANSTETLYLSQDGVLRTYYEMLQMNAQIGNFDFSNFGVFSEQQKEDMTTKFLAMRDAWEKNMNRILSNTDWADSFLRQLQSLKEGMVDDYMNKDYLQFLYSVKEEIQKTQKLLNPIPLPKDEKDEEDKEPKDITPKYRPRYPTYRPQQPTQPGSQPIPNQQNTADAGNTGNVRIYNLYFPIGTTTAMKYDFRQMFLEVLGDNPDGFAKKVSVILKEYE